MNQRNIDEENYLSEDNFVCKKGRTEAYILVMDTLNIYGPKHYKFGDPDLNYYFQLKTNAETYKQQLIKFKKELKMAVDKLPKTKKGFLKRNISKTQMKSLPSKPEFVKEVKVLTLTEQILKIKSLVGFNKWLKDNNLVYDVITSNDAKITFNIQKKANFNPIMNFSSSLKGLPKCCGAYEDCYHVGSYLEPVLPEFTMNHWRVLAKYFARSLDEKMKAGLYGTLGHYYISHIKSPGAISNSSARWGEILKRSKYFKKVGNFINSNTDNYLDVYVSTQTYVNLYNEE